MALVNLDLLQLVKLTNDNTSLAVFIYEYLLVSALEGHWLLDVVVVEVLHGECLPGLEEYGWFVAAGDDGAAYWGAYLVEGHLLLTNGIHLDVPYHTRQTAHIWFILHWIYIFELA